MKALRMRTRVDLTILPRRIPQEPASLKASGFTGLLLTPTHELGGLLGDPSPNQMGGLLLPEAAKGGDTGLQFDPEGNVVQGAEGRFNPFSNVEEIETAPIQQLQTTDYKWEVNPISHADTLVVEIDSRVLPVDPRVIRGMVVDSWLFVHEDNSQTFDSRMAACKHGQEGHFRGIAKGATVSWPDLKVTIRCEDMSALFRRQRILGEELDAVPLGRPLWECVRYLVDLIPGGDRWKVIPRGEIATSTSPTAIMSTEKRVKRRKMSSQPYTDVTAETTEAEEFFSFFTGEYPAVTVTAETGIAVTAEKEWVATAEQPSEADEFFSFFTGETPSVVVTATRQPAYTYFNQSVPPTPADVFGDSVDTVWDAISRLCYVMGAVPEVAVDDKGDDVLFVIDAREALDGTSFRPFSRVCPDGELRLHRVFIVGDEIDSVEMDRSFLSEGRGSRVDWVEAFAPDPDSGKILRERWGRVASDGAGDKNGRHVMVPGCTSREHLAKVARSAFERITHEEAEAYIEIGVPWSWGGSPSDADLLGLGAGALISLDLNTRARNILRGKELETVFLEQGVPPEAAELLAVATEEVQPRAEFQVSSIQWGLSGDNAPTIKIKGQQFVDGGVDRDILDVEEVFADL
jgi:hypothetical protein